VVKFQKFDFLAEGAVRQMRTRIGVQSNQHELASDCWCGVNLCAHHVALLKKGGGNKEKF
jgi:hypothetical protein